MKKKKKSAGYDNNENRGARSGRRRTRAETEGFLKAYHLRFMARNTVTKVISVGVKFTDTAMENEHRIKSERRDNSGN